MYGYTGIWIQGYIEIWIWIYHEWLVYAKLDRRHCPGTPQPTFHSAEHAIHHVRQLTAG